ncbi:MAG: DoxX family protein [Tepidisphaeraceae bacterium]|jgi:uncharacterized membrane protein
MADTERSSKCASSLRPALRCLAGLGFILAGANHFRSTVFYKSIIPPAFPSPYLLVIISGIAEMAGGIGLFIPRLRRSAGRGLIALLIAVFPANIYMAITPDSIGAAGFAHWMLWLRLPLQVVFIVWVWFAAGPEISPRRRKGRRANSN